MPYQQKNGTWRATRMIDGKRRQKVFITKSEAKKWESTQSSEDWNQAQPTLTIFCLASEYLTYAQARYVRKTYQEKQVAVRNLLRFINPSTLAVEIPRKLIMDALMHRAKASGNAANKDRKNLAAMWVWAARLYDEIDARSNPFADIPRFAFDGQGRYIPPEADFWSAYNAAGQDDQVYLLAMLHTAARRDELFRLLWSDVDLEAGTIRLGTRKTATGSMEHAHIPMTTELRHALTAHRKRGVRSLYVFSTPEGQPYKWRQHYMHRLCTRAGVKPFGFHAVRHLSASILARAGVPLPTIQAILRHKSATTTARYLHSLGIIENVLDAVFTQNKKAPDADTSEATKKAIYP